jgi:hypothetical protein
MVDDMVSYEVFSKSHRDTDALLVFRTLTHMRLFSVLLVDFLSQPRAGRGGSLPFDLPQRSETARDADRTSLLYLRQVVATPKLGEDTTLMVDTLNDFSDWLEAEACVRGVWLPSLEATLDFTIRRLELLKICGDIAKHSVLRLDQISTRLRRQLEANGRSIHEWEAYLVLPEFYEWFHGNVFADHSSTIAAYLNDLRLGIFRYLQPEFVRAYHDVEPRPSYGYHIPPTIVTPLAKAMYWELMNKVRARPWMPRFEVSPCVRTRY